METQSNGEVGTTVLVLTSTDRDAAVVRQSLVSAGLKALCCKSMEELCNRIPDDGAAALISDEMLSRNSRLALRARLSLQPVWSDFPIIILASFRGNIGPGRLFLEESSHLSQVLLLKRPTHRAALISTVSAALQSRARQLQVRDHMEENVRTQKALRESREHLHRLNETLETRIAERTNQLQRERLRLRQLAKELTETEHRMRRHMAATLHDGLQQLLVGTQMQVSLLARSYPDEALARIQQLLSDALDVSRSLAYELSPPILHESNLLEALDWLARRFEERQDFRVHLQLPGKSPPVPESLKIFLYSAVQELLLNCIKHSGEREATLEFRSEDSNGFLLAVSDRGRGFDPMELDATTELRGFGLFSIRERLAALGGTFEVDSAPGNGARFIIHLKTDELPQKTESVQVPPPGLNGPKRVGDRSSDRLRILIADDHGMVREGLIALLNEQGDFQIVGEAEDGLEAVSLAEELAPDVIIMDVNMPNLGGIESTRLIKSRHPHIQVIGLSLHESDAVENAMLSAGAATFLRKDGPAETLFRTIRRVCHAN